MHRKTFVFTVLAVYAFSKVNCATICELTVCECIENNNTLVAKCWLDQEALKYNLTLSNTTSFDLSENNLTIIQAASVFESSILQELYLNNNYIKEISQNAFKLPELNTLDLSHNLLEKLDIEIFKGIPKLENLYLANNKFTITSQLNFGYLVKLQKINLNNNFLGPDIILRPLFNESGYGLPLTIKSISLSGINLTDLPRNYFEEVDKSLQVLVVSNNRLTTLFKLPLSLEYLDISSNLIKNLSLADFPDAHPLTYLRVLKLNNLQIEKIHKNVFSALTLTDLELSSNKHLTEFSNLTFGRQILTNSYDFNIKNLSLRGSNLSTIDEGLSVLFERVDSLDLQDNPWVCDCYLTWVRRLPISPNLTEDLRCAYPRHLHNARLFDLEPADFKCPKYQSGWVAYETGITVGALMYSVIVLVTLVWIYKFVHRPAPNINRQGYTQMR